MSASPVLRHEISLTHGWQFITDPEDRGEKLGWQDFDYKARNWKRIMLPHTWNTMKAYTSYEGIAWYRLTFDAPPQPDRACVFLKFEAVFYIARIWLNGEYLGEHEGGYTPFEFNITSQVRLGAENILVVRVDNRRATNRLPAHLFEGRSYGWNNYGGIVRDVKLILTSQVYLDALRLVATPHLTGIDQADQASLFAQVFVHNMSRGGFNGQLILDVLEEGSSHIKATAIEPVDIAPGMKAILELKIGLQNPRLWHFDHPHLYSCVTSLKDNAGIEYDRSNTIFGIREVGWKNGQFLLNGEPVRLAGLSRHANVPGFGLAETNPVMTRDFDDLKALNMVLGRPVHYPQHEFIYDYCDRKGILLSPELPAWQLTAGQLADPHMRALAKQQLAEMIAAAANHPCIWAWSVGNEFESDTVAGRAYVHDMVEYVKSLDPTRPVGFASYHLLIGRPWGDATKYSDFVMMNQYFGTWHGPKDSLGPALDTIHLTWPDKIVIISEFGFFPHWQRIEGPSLMDPAQYYSIPEGVSTDSPQADAQRQYVIKDQMAVFRSRPFVAAVIFWDYRGGMGVVDIRGRPRPSWHTLQEEFAPLTIERLDLAIPEPEKDQCKVHITLRTRGPIEVDLPAYTLRNYKVTWRYLSRAGAPLDLCGEAVLPVLPPGTMYELTIDVPRQVNKSKLRISVLRPTGFVVLYRDLRL